MHKMYRSKAFSADLSACRSKGFQGEFPSTSTEPLAEKEMLTMATVYLYKFFV